MPQPLLRSGVYYFRQVVPEELRKTVGKRELRWSLNTKDAREAKPRFNEAARKATAILERAKACLATAANGPTRLTHRQVVALAAEWHRRELGALEDDPGEADGWNLVLSNLGDAYEDAVRRARARAGFESVDEGPDTPDDVTPDWLTDRRLPSELGRILNEARALLTEEGVAADDESLARLAEQLFARKVHFYRTLIARCGGDYRPSQDAERAPRWERPQAPSTSPKPAHSGPTYGDLIDAWKAERRPKLQTEYEWRRVLDRLRDHVGHDNPARLTPDDVIAWKDALVASGKSTKTVRNHLFAVNTLFNWAVRNRRVTANPATGVGVAMKKSARGRRLPFDDADVRTILTAAREEQGARRWVPWLLAFTGARLEEVCQALTTDIREKDGIAYLDINEDTQAKSLKNLGSARQVPLHPALKDEGFLDYVRSVRQGGSLFPDLKPDRFGKLGGNYTKFSGRWVRSLGIDDPRKVPNHSWRHRFKDVCRDAGIQKDVHDALTGHMSGDVGDQYGRGHSLASLARAIALLPVPPHVTPGNAPAVPNRLAHRRPSGRSKRSGMFF